MRESHARDNICCLLLGVFGAFSRRFAVLKPVHNFNEPRSGPFNKIFQQTTHSLFSISAEFRQCHNNKQRLRACSVLFSFPLLWSQLRGIGDGPHTTIQSTFIFSRLLCLRLFRDFIRDIFRDFSRYFIGDIFRHSAIRPVHTLRAQGTKAQGIRRIASIASVRSPLPGASICAVPLSQPFPIKNYF